MYHASMIHCMLLQYRLPNCSLSGQLWCYCHLPLQRFHTTTHCRWLQGIFIGSTRYMICIVTDTLVISSGINHANMLPCGVCSFTLITSKCYLKCAPWSLEHRIVYPTFISRRITSASSVVLSSAYSVSAESLIWPYCLSTKTAPSTCLPLEHLRVSTHL
jgi:hypothetical protein